MDELEQLTSLLVSPEKRRLDQLEKRLNDAYQRTQEIAAILPAAVRAIPDQADLMAALQVPVDNCLKQSVQQEPQNFIKAIWPLLRRMITEILKPIEHALQAQQQQLSELTHSVNNFESIHASQQKQLSRQEKLLEELKRSHLAQFKQLQTLLQSQQTQLNELEKYLGNLEQAYVNQQMQLGDLKQHANTLEQAKVNQEMQLKEINKQAQNTVGKLEKQISQIDNHITRLEQTQVKKLIKRTQDFEQLKARYHQLEQHLIDPQLRAREIAEILPDAILQSAQQNVSEINASATSLTNLPAGIEDSKFTESLQIPVDVCLRKSLKRNVRPFVDALFPLIGPTIRQAIGEAFKELMQRINAILEQSIFSSKGIAWRIQAWRTGQSLAEIVLTKTLIYRIEQVFLIHRESGLLIHHLHLEDADVGDSDAVSAMFTAIQDFIHDSFSASKQEDLNRVEVGKYTVWVERGPYAVLACVIRGDAPRKFRDHMQNILENIHAHYGALLEQFSGDNSQLQSCLPLLEKILWSETKSDKQPRWMTPQLLIILSAISLGVSLWGYNYLEHQRRLNIYINTLQDTSGIIVITTKHEGGKLVVHGMRDPLAQQPQEIALHFGLSDEDVIFKGTAYQDLEPTFVEHRLRQWLQPPDSVHLSLQGTTLHLSGHADQAWVDKLHEHIGMVAGIHEIVTDQLTNTETLFQAFLKKLNNTPGIIVVSSGTEKGQRFVTGMRDPLATDPTEIANRMQISEVTMRWTPYQDLTPSFIEQRVQQRLNPPATVQFKMQDNVLSLSGHAPSDWIEKALQDVRSVDGINQVKTNELVDTDSFLLAEAKRELKPPDNIILIVKNKVLQIIGHVNSATFEILQGRLQKLKKLQKEKDKEFAHFDTSGLIDAEHEFQQLKRYIEKTKIYFYEGADLIPNQEIQLQNLRDHVQKLLAFSQDLHQSVHLKIIGNTDGLDTESYNQQLSIERAQVVFDWLLAHGIEKQRMITSLPPQIRFGESQPNPDDRNVNFRVLSD